jgi:TetR/AcrR family transcriptional repressor of nem operon
MSAQFDDLPNSVKTDVQAFADVNIAWLKKTLVAAKVVSPKKPRGEHTLSTLESWGLN